jgi:hypothetical protein
MVLGDGPELIFAQATGHIVAYADDAVVDAREFHAVFDERRRLFAVNAIDSDHRVFGRYIVVVQKRLGLVVQLGHSFYDIRLLGQLKLV